MWSVSVAGALGTLATLTVEVSAGFSTSSQSNVAVYWGQNSLGSSTAPLAQQRLIQYCKNPAIDIFIVAFLTKLTNPTLSDLNFANIDPSTLSSDIKECQATYNKSVLLSLGGATFSDGGWSTPAEATAAAANLWSIFGPSTASVASRPFAPFGSSVINGFDIDVEAPIANGIPFAQELRRQMDASSKVDGKKYLLTSAPQCPYPDQNVGPMLAADVAFDLVMIQFYNNNWCGVISFNVNSDAQDKFNLATWDTWAKETSKNPNVKIMVGVAGGPTAAGSGYVTPDVLAKVMSYSKRFTSFGGLMVWDVSQAYGNSAMLSLFDSEHSTSGSPNVPIASTSGKAYPSTSSKANLPTPLPSKPTTMATSAKVVKPTTKSQSANAPKSTTLLNILPSSIKQIKPVPTSIKQIIPVQTTIKPIIATTPTKTLLPVKPITTAKNVKPVPTIAPGNSPALPLVNQWNQCAGRDWNGGKVCKVPFTCKYFSEWYSQCE